MRAKQNPKKLWGFYCIKRVTGSFCIAIMLFCILLYNMQKKKDFENFSEQERLHLTNFFSAFFCTEPATFTLFGTKPLTLSVQVCDSDAMLFQRGHYWESLRAMYIWEKHKLLFYQKQFCLKFEKKKSSIQTWLINKKAAHKAIEENIDYFRHVLKKEVNPTQLVEEMIGGEYLEEAIGYHEGLLGVLLGYGRENSELFCRLSKVSKKLKKQVGFTENGELEKKLGFFALEKKGFSLFGTPCFRAVENSNETRLLQEQYSKELTEISQKYMLKDFLQVTIERLCEEKDEKDM